MTKTMTVKEVVRQEFVKAQISVHEIEVRKYPEESIVIVRVDEEQMRDATDVANRLDGILDQEGFSGFVIVKKADDKEGRDTDVRRVTSLSDSRVADLVNLLTARARTTELQPSLEYIPDAKNNIASARLTRHHLVFGRRGSGKTALLAETKRIIESSDGLSTWLNIQTYRHESCASVFLYFAQRLCQLVQSHFKDSRHLPQVVTEATKLLDRLNLLLAAESPSIQRVRHLVPGCQQLLRRFLDSTDRTLYIFLDDFHYLEKQFQPELLDLIHGCVRDCDAWLKVAAIQHLARCFDPSSQLGLQGGHDAATINLDITLQDPGAAKQFLETVLSSYAVSSGIASINHVFSPTGALDRLVLASGAVPRDYLTLCSTSIQEAKHRPNAKRVGVQDVNKAAGDAKQLKLDELEDDAAAVEGESSVAIATLQKVRHFCLEEKNWTYFRIDFREKELRMEEYGRLQMLVDLRFIHLVEPSLSDEHQAGSRSEVYMLDLSQFAGQRLKRKLNVLDFVEGYLILKKRVGVQQDRIGDTANKRLGILRRAPLFELAGMCD